MIVADWFFVGDPYDIDPDGTIYTVSGTDTNAKDGDIILARTQSGTPTEAYSYHIWDASAGRVRPLAIDLPLSMVGKASVANEILLSDIEGDRLLMYIRQGSGNGTDDLGLNGTEEYVEDKVYDLSDRSSVITLKNNAY